MPLCAAAVATDLTNSFVEFFRRGGDSVGCSRHKANDIQGHDISAVGRHFHGDSPAHTARRPRPAISSVRTAGPRELNGQPVPEPTSEQSLAMAAKLAMTAAPRKRARLLGSCPLLHPRISPKQLALVANVPTITGGYFGRIGTFETVSAEITLLPAYGCSQRTTSGLAWCRVGRC
jgi:hypothetical protein